MFLYLYPTLKKREEFKSAALEAIEEHLQVKTLLGAINCLSDGSERFDAKLKVLIDDVEHHIEEEELEELGQRLEAAKKELGKKARAKAASSR